MTANEITATLLIEIPKRFPRIKLWRNNRIDTMAVGRGGNMRRVSAGIDGQGDVCGLIGPEGRMIQLEIKAGKDRIRPSQMGFRAMIQNMGGIYLEIRSVEQGLADLEKLL